MDPGMKVSSDQFWCARLVHSGGTSFPDATPGTMAIMDDGDSTIETHPLNPGARRQRGGYWNEDTLPITEWETSERRVVVPHHL
jgi:hypothetical protein